MARRYEREEMITSAAITVSMMMTARRRDVAADANGDDLLCA